MGGGNVSLMGASLAGSKYLIRNYRPWETPRELPRTVLALVWFFLCTFSTSLVNVHLDRTNPFLLPPLGHRLRLPDPLLDTFNPGYLRAQIPPDLPDTLVHIAPAIMLFRVVIGGKQSCWIFRQLGYIVGTAYLIRLIFVSMTILPNSNVNCLFHVGPSLLSDAVLVMLQMKQTCGDVVFSGHTIMFMSASLVWINNPLKNIDPNINRIINFITITFSFTGIISLVASAYHYTLDCVLSILTMSFMWTFYHYLVRQPHLDHTAISRLVNYIDGYRHHKQPPPPDNTDMV
ncbi:hypothetical protein DSO57_1026309 [Entomophthora muscae]|uniref:Uncharacterized protein n=1 Tax=Entomophthora muscae TaxID=34485 RepID=A0ACC2U0L3_9FUNG|nr:hypothetical protein DSO57_1026309 [Entomophthora muscae]